MGGSPGDEYRFTGHLRDSESGNDYAGARYYSNHRGRWLSTDPELGDWSNPQRLNRYTYVLNDPINYADPDGQNEVSYGGVNFGAWSGACWPVKLPGELGKVTLFCFGDYGTSGSPAPQRPTRQQAEGFLPRISEALLDSMIDPEKWDDCMGQIGDRIPEGPERDLRLDVLFAQVAGWMKPYSGAWFINIHRTGSAWDFKQGHPEWADYGNFHFGLVAAAYDFPDWASLAGAALYQWWDDFWKTGEWKRPIADNEDDPPMILAGAEFYRDMMDCVNGGQDEGE